MSMRLAWAQGGTGATYVQPISVVYPCMDVQKQETPSKWACGGAGQRVR